MDLKSTSKVAARGREGAKRDFFHVLVNQLSCWVVMGVDRELGRLLKTLNQEDYA
jgi:hypothetical protein